LLDYQQLLHQVLGNYSTIDEWEAFDAAWELAKIQELQGRSSVQIRQSDQVCVLLHFISLEVPADTNWFIVTIGDKQIRLDWDQLQEFLHL